MEKNYQNHRLPAWLPASYRVETKGSGYHNTFDVCVDCADYILDTEHHDFIKFTGYGTSHHYGQHLTDFCQYCNEPFNDR